MPNELTGGTKNHLSSINFFKQLLIFPTVIMVLFALNPLIYQCYQ